MSTLPWDPPLDEWEGRELCDYQATSLHEVDDLRAEIVRRIAEIEGKMGAHAPPEGFDLARSKAKTAMSYMRAKLTELKAQRFELLKAEEGLRAGATQKLLGEILQEVKELRKWLTTSTS